MKKNILFLLVTLFSFNFINAQNVNTIEPKLQEVLSQKSDEMISVNIILKSQIEEQQLKEIALKANDRKTKREIVVNELKSFSKRTQSDIMSILDAESKNGSVDNVRCHWLVNAISCEAGRDLIYLLSNHNDVAAIAYNESSYLLWDEKMTMAESPRGMTQNITHVNADDVWDLGYTGKGVLIAVLDTGVNINHIDLVNNLWDGGEEYPNHGYNTYENNHDVEDGFGHGTHCAGIICGDGSSGTQTGIAPDATVMCVKVMDNAGYGSASSISAGMEFALEHGADVMNMSLGIPNATAAVKEMLRNACVNTMYAGVTAAVAAGNEGQLQISFPAPNNVRVPGGCPPPWIHPDQEINAGDLSCCVTVGAVDFNNQTAAFSSRGPVTWQNTSYGDYPYQPEIGLIRPDLCAPGVGIVSCNPYSNTNHVTMEGTSQAAPCMAGVMCLMLEKNPELQPEDICRILETTVTQLDENKNNDRGSGLINALAAVENVENGNDDEEICGPAILNATAIDEYSIALSWNTVPTAKSYDIYRNGDLIENVTTTSYNDVELNPSTEYCYTVVTVCENSESEHSNEACATTNELIIPCNAPTNINATIEQDADGYAYNFKVTMTWDAADNANQYVIYLDDVMLDVTNNTSYIKGFDEEGTHSFAVVTVCENAESEMSETFEFELIGESIGEYEKNCEIYPNPVDDVLYIKSDNNINEVNIYNVVGIKLIAVSGQQSAVSVDMSGFKSGVYFVEIDGNVFRIIRS